MLISAELKGCRGVLLVYMFFGSSLGKKTMLNCSLIRYFTLFHFMRAIDRTRTRATSLMRVKNSTRHLCLRHLLSGTLERRK